ncbi:hypothetical protein LAZ67_18002076, partial [Cordylochernes scorpioides]
MFYCREVSSHGVCSTVERCPLARVSSHGVCSTVERCPLARVSSHGVCSTVERCPLARVSSHGVCSTVERCPLARVSSHGVCSTVERCPLARVSSHGVCSTVERCPLARVSSHGVCSTVERCPLAGVSSHGVCSTVERCPLARVSSHGVCSTVERCLLARLKVTPACHWTPGRSREGQRRGLGPDVDRLCEALIDTGADLSVVDLRTALFAGREINSLTKTCSGPDGKKLDMVGSIILDLKIDDTELSHEFVVMDAHLRTLILGRDFLKKMNAKIDCKRETIKYNLMSNHDVSNYDLKKIKSTTDTVIPKLSIKLIRASIEAEDGEYVIEENNRMTQTNGLRLARSLLTVTDKKTHIWITNPYPRPLKIMKDQTLAYGSLPAGVNFIENKEKQNENDEIQFQINKNLSFKEQERLKQILAKYTDLFSSRLGRTNLAKHQIHTEDAKPIKHKPYRVSAKERTIIKDQIDEMLEEGIIRQSSSPWSFPVILVKKRDGKYRFCVDYRKLNEVTVKDVYPIPRIDDVMDTLQGSKYFSAIDLKSGYWQVEIEERDKEKTAFTTAHGLYEFNVMPFGLCNAPATFERNMDNVLGNLRWQICLCYLDDVIIYSSDFPTHIKRLEAVLRCFSESNLKLNAKKCRFAFEELEILVHITNQEGIKPAEYNIKAVRDFPQPKKAKEVQSFLGMCSYYRKFIKDFSLIADPLTSLIRKNVQFIWTGKQEEAFQNLKKALMNPPILGHFDPNAATCIHTDASNIGLGATLIQNIGGEEKVISYLSRTLSKPEQNYSTTEKECLAVVWSISKLRPYLYGRNFKIVTDHHALCWLKNLKDPTGRLARWALKIQEYNFQIIHKSGKKHLDADGLSRGPLPENEWDEYYERLFLNQIIDEKDDFIDNIKENLSGNKRSITQNFKEENGCLYKKNPNPEGREWLLTCHLCQSRKGSNQLPSGLLQPIPPANYPFERIGIDFVGPLPSTKRRRKWIIVLTDYYTKYAETKAVPEATVKEVSTFLIEHIFLRHGAPRFLISDRGSQFTSNLMKEVMKMCKVKHCFTTSYHPQTNGLTERLNRTLINMISMYVNTDQKNWDEILPFITHAYNTTIQETTGYSPFFLLFGREPMSLLDDENIPTDSNMDDYDEYIENYLDKIARTRQEVINNTEKTQERMKRNYDKKHNERTYEPGHLVAVWTPVRKIGKCEKLLRKYFGPYRILKKLSNVNYLIELKDNPGQDPLIVHVSRFKPYFERIDEVNHEDIQPPETFDFSTPNEWPKWRKRFERYLVVSGMKKKEEADKIDLFMYLMGDRADDIFRTFKFEKEEEATKIDSVLKAFDSHFCVRKNIIYERAKFNSRIQEDREPVDEFITSLYKLADSCEFEGLHEQLIRDRIVVGVRDKALSERMQLDSELTLEKAVKMVRQQEAVRQQQVDLQRPSTSQKVNQVKFNSKNFSPKQQQQPSRKKEKSAKTRSRCPKCGGFTHREGQACRAEGQRCNLCSKTGHFANCCPDKQAKTAEVKAVSELDEEIGFLLEVSAVEDSSNLDDDEGECRRRWTAEIQVNGKKVKFKLDSQADVTCVPLCLFKKIMGQQRLVESDINLRAAEFSELQTVGMFISTLRNGNYEIKEKIYVIRRLSEPLLSRRACELLNLARRIEVVATRINPIKEFPEVFEGLGQIGNPYEIKLKPGAKPYAVHTPRRVPIPLMKKLKTRLEELEKAGIIAQVNVATEWCAPTVIAGKPNGDIRLCVDLSRLNEHVQREVHPMPVVEHMLGQLGEARFFSKLDANSGFHQIPLSPDCQHLTTFITPFGRYKYCRMPFGISLAPEYFQKVMSIILQGMDGVMCYLDDILIFASDSKTHDRILRLVLRKLKEAKVTLNKAKCVFGVPRINFLGHILDEDGIRPDPAKIEAVARMPAPTDVHGVRRFLGVVNHLGRKRRTTLPIAPGNLNPKLVDSQTLKRKEGRRRKDMKSRYDRRCGATDMEELSEGDTVWITDMRTWGIVKKKASTPRSYMVDTPVGTLRRNRFHLRKGVTVQYPADPSTPTFSGEELVENEKTPVVDYPSNDSEDGQIRTR